jgi:hypothetical protein
MHTLGDDDRRVDPEQRRQPVDLVRVGGHVAEPARTARFAVGDGGNGGAAWRADDAIGDGHCHHSSSSSG